MRLASAVEELSLQVLVIYLIFAHFRESLLGLFTLTFIDAFVV